MKNLNKILSFIKHDMLRSHIDKINVCFIENGEYKPLFRNRTEVSLSDILICRKPYEVVEYICECHCLFLKRIEVNIYDYYMKCQVRVLLEKGFICTDIIFDSYTSKKAMNNAILAWLKKKNPYQQSFTLKEFAVYYDVPWFLEV